MHNYYTIWRYFNYTGYPHMLNNFICSRPLFRRVKDCKVVNTGMRSDHTAILTSFKTTAIKFKVTEKLVEQIDWKLIGYNKLTNELFNNSSSKYIAGETTYSKYTKHILEAGTNTVKISNHKNKGWFHFSRDSLLPLIEERDTLIYDYQNLGIGKGDSSEAKLQLSVSQLAVDDAIALAKAAWSAHQPGKIHFMRFKPKEAWQNVRVLSGGGTSHHTLPTVMRIRLPNAELATTDAENASVFGPHFFRVFNNHKPIGWPMLENIKQI